MTLSKCCKATATVMGGNTGGCTNWYECGKCGEACDVMPKTTKPKNKVGQPRIDGDHQHFKYCPRAWSEDENCKCTYKNIVPVGGRRKGSR